MFSYHMGPLLHGLNQTPVWVSNHIRYRVWDEITYPFPKFNGVTFEILIWIYNFILHFTGMWLLITWVT